MRYCFLFLVSLLALATGCQKKSTPEPYMPLYGLPIGMLDLEVEGIPKANVRFPMSEENRNPNRIAITLPRDYPANAPIKLKFRLAEGFSIDGYTSTMVLANYNGRRMVLAMMHPEGRSENIHVSVNTTGPITVPPSTGNKYEFTLEHAGNVYLDLPVSNWGTSDNPSDGKVFIRNKTTGETTMSGVSFHSDKPDSPASISIPGTLTAGEYELSIGRDNRQVAVPDPLVLRYGEPTLYPSTTTALESTGYTVSFTGCNITPENSYKLEIKNDFLPARQFDLTPLNHLSVGAQLPADLPAGSYEATLYLNGKAVEYSNLMTGVDLLFIRNNEQQPVMGLLSKLSTRLDVHVGGLTIFKPANSFSRNDELIVYVAAFPKDIGNSTNAEVRLFLKNAATGKEYEQRYTGIFKGIGGTPYYQYTPAGDMPAGNYEARLSVYNKTTNELHFSEKYHWSVHIE